jgi:hypothetical protein
MEQILEGQKTKEQAPTSDVERASSALVISQPTDQIALTKSIVPSAEIQILPQDCGCGGGANGTLGYVFAIGRLYPTFPNKSIEKEYDYAYQEFKADGPPNALFYQVLSQGKNLYIAQQICWILQIDGVDTYIVKPRTDAELYHFIASLEPVNVGELHYDVIVGKRGPVASAEECNGLQLPTVVCDLSYDFTFNQFVTNVQASISGIPTNVVQSMLQQMLQISDNAGETDAHRAINYLTIRNKDIYTMAWQMQVPTSTPPYPPGAYFLQNVNVTPANVQGNRSIVDVIFEYLARDTYEKYFWYVKVDVTGEFPFLASKQIAKYYPAP